MWILLIVLFGVNGGIASEQMNFATLKECEMAKNAIEKRFTPPGVVGKCICIDVDQ